MKTLIAVQDRTLIDELMPLLKQHSWPEAPEFQVIHVVERPYVGYHVDMELHQHIHVRAEEMVGSVVKEIEQTVPSAKVEGAVLEGSAKEEIVRLAQSMPADLIVMGSHGRGLFGRAFLGSVSLAVHAAAPCSILILRAAHRTEQQRP